VEEYDGEEVDSAKGPAGIGSCTTVSTIGAAISPAAANFAGAAVGRRATASAIASTTSVGRTTTASAGTPGAAPATAAAVSAAARYRRQGKAG
jgi:hypothetical protein